VAFSLLGGLPGNHRRDLGSISPERWLSRVCISGEKDPKTLMWLTHRGTSAYIVVSVAEAGAFETRLSSSSERRKILSHAETDPASLFWMDYINYTTLRGHSNKQAACLKTRTTVEGSTTSSFQQWETDRESCILFRCTSRQPHTGPWVESLLKLSQIVPLRRERPKDPRMVVTVFVQLVWRVGTDGEWSS